MTVPEFLLRLEEYWGTLNARESEEWLSRLEKFSDRELEDLWDWLVEQCHYMPKLAKLYQGARELRILGDKGWTKHFASEEVNPDSDCEKCKGSGLAPVQDGAYRINYACDCEDGLRWPKLQSIASAPHWR